MDEVEAATRDDVGFAALDEAGAAALDEAWAATLDEVGAAALDEVGVTLGLVVILCITEVRRVEAILNGRALAGGVTAGGDA